MMDKKLKISIGIIIVLLLVVGYFVNKPQLDKYLINRDIKTAENIVGQIATAIRTQGYIILNFEDKQMILVEYIEPEVENEN